MQNFFGKDFTWVLTKKLNQIKNYLRKEKGANKSQLNAINEENVAQQFSSF